MKHRASFDTSKKRVIVFKTRFPSLNILVRDPVVETLCDTAEGRWPQRPRSLSAGGAAPPRRDRAPTLSLDTEPKADDQHKSFRSTETHYVSKTTIN